MQLTHVRRLTILLCSLILALTNPLTNPLLAQDDPTSANAAAEQPLVETLADEVTDSTGEAIEGMISGDLVTAAKKSGELFTRFGIPAITALVVLIAAYFVAAFLARLCSVPIRKRVDETLGKFVGKLVFYLIMVSALLGVLQYFGIGITSFAAVLAAAGFAIGLAFQGTLSNSPQRLTHRTTAASSSRTVPSRVGSSKTFRITRTDESTSRWV